MSDGQVFAARLLPDLTVQGSFDKLISGPDTLKGFGAQIGIDLNMLRLRGVARRSGEASKRQVRLYLAWAEWQAAGQARLLGVRVLALSKQLVLARLNATSAQRLFEASSRAAGRGDIAASDLDTRRQAALDSGDRARIVERDLVTARGELNKQLGLPPRSRSGWRRTRRRSSPRRRPSWSTMRSCGGSTCRRSESAMTSVKPGCILRCSGSFRPSLTLAGARDTAGNLTLGPQVGLTLPLCFRDYRATDLQTEETNKTTFRRLRAAPRPLAKDRLRPSR